VDGQLRMQDGTRHQIWEGAFLKVLHGQTVRILVCIMVVTVVMVYFKEYQN
jgi:hypothetical protein